MVSLMPGNYGILISQQKHHSIIPPWFSVSPLYFLPFLYVDKHSQASDSQGSNLYHSYVALGMSFSLFVAQFPHI